MTMINDPAEKLKETALSFVAEATEDGTIALEHYGVSGMKWGVRSQETLRKYGLLKGAKKGASSISADVKKAVKAASAKASSVAKVKMAAASSGVKKASAATVSNVKAKAAAKKQEISAKQAEDRQRKLIEKAYRKELGMSKRQYEKLHEQTLKSHDPHVVAKGMHTLTDKELNDKVTRLQTEAKIKNTASIADKQAAEARKARNDALTSSIPYKILSEPVKAVATDVIQKQLYETGLQPLLNQKISYASANAEHRFAVDHPGAKESQRSKEQRQAQVDADIASFKRDYANKLESNKQRAEKAVKAKGDKYGAELTAERRKAQSVQRVRQEELSRLRRESIESQRKIDENAKRYAEELAKNRRKK